MESLSSTMKHEIHCLLNPLQQTQTQSSSPGNQAKIQKVPPYLRERPMEFAKHYLPKVVSIGPIHHPKGEEFKKMWASNYLKYKVGQNQDDAEQLFGKIRSQIKELKSLYAEDAIRSLHSDDDKLALILFVDGCASLHVMRKIVENKPSKSKALDTIAQQDLLLLENQLPYEVLKILSNNDDDALRSFIKHFKNRFIETRGSEEDSHVQINQPAHLLDALIEVIVTKEHTEEHTEEHIEEHTEQHIEEDTKEHTIPIHDDKSPCKKRKDTKFPTHRNIQDLRTSGIKIKKNAGKSLTSISFRCCTLSMPSLMVDDFTVQTFMNMMAYEMCPDFKSDYEISNYVSLLNSLIDHADDVKV